MRSGGGQKGRALARWRRDCRGGTEAKRFQVTAVIVRDYWRSASRLLSSASIDYYDCNIVILPSRPSLHHLNLFGDNYSIHISYYMTLLILLWPNQHANGSSLRKGGPVGR